MNDTTREKILHISHKLFADKGFNGVSIREIASACDVNVAAINYHFKNKASLYQETIVHSIQHTNIRIKEIYENLDDPNIEKLSLEVFNFFMENAEDLRASFRLIMTTDEKLEALGHEIAKHNGPPGGEYFYKCLKSEINSATDEDLGWAVRTIFTQIIHRAIVMCNSVICESMTEIGMGINMTKKDLSRLIKVVLKELS